MKYNFSRILIIPFILLSCNQKPDGYIIKSNIEGLSEGKAVLMRRIESDFVSVDSTIIQDQEFIFTGRVDQPEMYYVHIHDTLPYIHLFIENAEINISGHIDSLRNPDIEGSDLNTALEEYNKMMKPYDDKLRDIYKKYTRASMAGDTAGVRSHEAQFDMIADQQKEASIDFVKENSDNVLGPYLTWGTLAYDLTISELVKLAENFSPDLAGSVYVEQINDYINTLKKVDIGQPFTDIALPSPEGEIKKLSDYKGKLILIDFWASWCGPCRRENPRVVELYNEFKDRNFEIYGVSLDRQKEKWIEAIDEDNLSWEHVSDLKGWNSEAGNLYGVRSIPHTVLINKEGIIIDKNLRGEDLRKKVEELVDG